MTSIDLNNLYQGTVLITGASGFIGRHLLQNITPDTTEIHTISRKKATFSRPVHQHNGDISDEQFVRRCITETEPDIIFHLAAYKARILTTEAFYASFQSNLMGTLNILHQAENLPSLKSIVVLGTAEEYGNIETPFREGFREMPVSPYSLSKLYVSHLCELFNRLNDLPVTVLRPTLAYGPGQGADMFLPSLIIALINNRHFDMSPGDQTRDFIFVDDLVEALILASVNTKVHGQIINIGSGIPVKLANLAMNLEKMLNRNGLVHHGSIPYRKNEIMEYCVDLRKAEGLLHWRAKTSLEAGLEKTIAYYYGVQEE